MKAWVISSDEPVGNIEDYHGMKKQALRR